MDIGFFIAADLKKMSLHDASNYKEFMLRTSREKLHEFRRIIVARALLLLPNNGNCSHNNFFTIWKFLL